MFRLAAVLALAVTPFLVTTLAAEEPLHTVVTAPSANVYSGPSDAFYIASKMTQGASVEVYRMTADGWCGIRPPKGSFSYVRADHVQADDADADLLITTTDNTKTRVGSTVNASHNVEYIALEKGERLKRIGEPVRLGSPPVKWCRVAPPSGEFRWVRSEDLDMSADADQEPAVEPLAAAIESEAPPADDTAADEVLSRDAASPAAHVATAETASATTAADGVPTQKLKPRGTMTTMPIPIIEETVAAARVVPPAVRAVVPGESAWKAVGTGTIESKPVAVPVADAESTLPPVITVLAELDVDVAQQVKKNVEDWQLGELLSEANNLYGRAMDPSTRTKIASLRSRIEQFQDIQRRHLQLAPVDQRVADNQVVLATAVVPAPRPPAGSLTSDRPSDRQSRGELVQVEGWLVPVQSSRRDIPRFALTDRNGEILYFVTPPPGLNMSQYQTSPVQVVGRLTQANSDQLVAERVTPKAARSRLR